jgi:hypothetical protein
MENINTTPEIPVQSHLPPIQQSPKENNIFKYLFFVSIIVLLITIVSFVLILNNKNSKEFPIEQKTNDISEAIPTEIVIPTIKTLTQEEELYPFINPEKDPNFVFKITKTEGNFAYVEFGSRVGGGAVAIWKKEGAIWRKLLATQDSAECETVMKENIPPSLVYNDCFYYKTQEAWKYNTISNQWEKK